MCSLQPRGKSDSGVGPPKARKALHTRPQGEEAEPKRPMVLHEERESPFLGKRPRRAQMGLLTYPPSLLPQGSGRYSIYIANYAYGNVGPDALIEMDPEASDLSQGILALRDVAAEAGVSKYTGRQSDTRWRGGGPGCCELEGREAWGWGLGPARLSLNHQRPWEKRGLCPWEGRMKAFFPNPPPAGGSCKG